MVQYYKQVAVDRLNIQTMSLLCESSSSGLIYDAAFL